MYLLGTCMSRKYLLANKTGEGNTDGNSDLTLLTLGSTESRY